MHRAAIGVFDSGIGGLTVAAEIVRQLPAEDLVYLDIVDSIDDKDKKLLMYIDDASACMQRCVQNKRIINFRV